MRNKRVFGLATGLIIVGGYLAVLSGCTGDQAESVKESQAQPGEGGPTMPGEGDQSVPDPGPERPEPGVSGFDGQPETSAPGPGWPEPDVRISEWPAGTEPFEGPAAPSTSPGFSLQPEPAPTPREGEPTVSRFPPSAVRSFALDPDHRMTQPAGIAEEGPVLFAPGNFSPSVEPAEIEPRPRMATPRMVESPFRVATPPPPMTASLPAPESVGDEPIAVEPPIPRPSVEIAPPEPAPVAVRSEGGLHPKSLESNPLGADAGAPDTIPETGVTPSGTGDEDYQVVSVFYGTDRSPVATSESERRGYLGWLYLTAACAVVTLALIIAASRLTRRLPVLLLAGAGAAATLLFGTITMLTRFPGEPVGPRPEWTYGDERGELVMGTCKVSIPKGHQAGAIERPSVFRFELREDPREHIVLLELEEQAADTFFAKLRERVEASPKKEAFVFVHGFNTTFDEAAYRTAQLAHDLKFPGAPVFFSWPSQGGLLQYSIDETNVVWAVPHLKEFLIAVARRSGANAVHLVAHSMGNRALASALQLLSNELRDEPPMFREVVLTAPDIDAEVFRRDIVPAIVPTADRVTLYASSNDEALKLSKAIHGYRRAGDSGGDLLVIPGVDTVDVSTVDTSLLGHEYYGNNQTVIADMLDLINESKPPQLRRFLEAKRMGELFYWVFHGDPRMLGTSQPAEAPVRR